MLDSIARIPPHDLAAERAVLGTLLLEGGAAHHRTQILEPEDFYKDANRLIFAAIREMYAG
jgi:replicative DNA helicase